MDVEVGRSDVFGDVEDNARRHASVKVCMVRMSPRGVQDVDDLSLCTVHETVGNAEVVDDEYACANGEFADARKPVEVVVGNEHAGVVVRAFVKMGDYCTMLNHSTIEGIVRLGTGVRIMTNVYISSRTWVGDHVFIGPGAIFLNGKYPGRRDEMRPPRGATVEDDVMIGGGTTILPEITIGERSFIAAGAVVIRDVEQRTTVAGVPAHPLSLSNKDRSPSERATS